MSVILGSARHNENGGLTGGKAGDQDGTEVSTQAYYAHKKGWYCFRPISPEVAKKLANAMQSACDNNNFGYCQDHRQAVEMVKKYGSMAKVTEKCETDCSNLVRGCIYEATKIDLGNFDTSAEPKVLKNSGLFEAQFSVSSENQLCTGDILVTKTKGHTVIVVSGNARSGSDSSSEKLGWIQSGDKWYYRKAVGENAHGFNDIKNADGKTRRYYFNNQGVMLTGWQEINSKWYYFQPSGDLAGAMYKSDSAGVQTIWVIK